MQITYRGTAPPEFTITMAETYMDLDFITAILARKHRGRHPCDLQNSRWCDCAFPSHCTHTAAAHRAAPSTPDTIYDISTPMKEAASVHWGNVMGPIGDHLD